MSAVGIAVLQGGEDVKSYNPLHVEFAQWVVLVRDLSSSRSLVEILGYLFMRPGWAPHGKGSTTEDLRAQQGKPPVEAT